MARRIERFLPRFKWGRKVVCWWGWKMAPWRYTTYWREECERLRACQIRDQLKIQDLKQENAQLKIQDLKRENARLKRGFRAVKR